MAEAWGDVATRQLPLSLGTGRHFVFDLAGTPDGQSLIGVDQPDGFDPSAEKDPSAAVLYDISSGKRRTMAPLATPTSQVLWAAADDHWVVWSEANDQPQFFDWRIVAFDRNKGTVRELTRATKVDGKAVPGPYPLVSVSHGLAVWGQGIGPMDKGPATMMNAAAMQADLATGKISTLATSAGSAVIDWPSLAWEVWSGDSWSVSVTNLQTHEVRLIDQTAATFTVNGKSAAYNDAASSSVYLIDDIAAQTPPRLLAKGVDEADHLEWVTLNARVVAWDQTTVTRVYDRLERRLVDLPMTWGRSGVYVCGPLIVWEDFDQGASGQDDATHIVLVDTRDLPVRP